MHSEYRVSSLEGEMVRERGLERVLTVESPAADARKAQRGVWRGAERVRVFGQCSPAQGVCARAEVMV